MHVLISYHNEPDDRRSNTVLFLHLANNVEQWVNMPSSITQKLLVFLYLSVGLKCVGIPQ